MEGFGLLGSQLPPGFRFHPTDQELIIHYLRKRVTSSLTPATSIIAEIDLYKFNPWELPDKAFFGESEWFFFTPRDRKYPNGSRPNRGAGCGYWKATGIDKPIIATGRSQCLGVKKALVFYQGRPPKGTKTDWVMHEYRLLDDKSSSCPHKPNSMRLDDWVLCRVRQKGIIPNEADEKQETSVLNNLSSFNSTVGKAAQPTNLMKNKKPRLSPGEHENFTERKKSINEWSDRQLLAYLTGSQEEGGESASEVLDSPNSFSPDSSGGSCEYGTGLTQPSQQVSSMLDSIKRTLSFGALDELMLQPPSKRLHYTSICEQSSLTSSFSVDQLYPQFII